MFNLMNSDAPETTHEPPESSRRPTARQVAAVYEVMRLLRRDRPGGGVEEQFVCDRCGRSRDRSGSVTYGDLHFCNGCATDYELIRLAESSRRGPAPAPEASSTN
jgi:hypothetical protein